MAHPPGSVRAGNSFQGFYQEADRDQRPRGLSPERARAAIAGHTSVVPRERTYSSSSSSSNNKPVRLFSTGADGKARSQSKALDQSIIAMRDNLADERGWAGWERLCERNFDKFSITNFANAFYSAAVYVRDEDKPEFLRRHDAIITRLLKRIQNHIENDDPETIVAQTLSTTIYALAKFKKKDQGLIQAISKCAQNRIEVFNEQNCGNTAWAFEQLKIADVPLFKAIGNRFRALIQQGRVERIALNCVAMAFAKLNIPDPLLFKAITAHVQTKIDELQEQGCSSIAWAFSTLGIKDSNLFNSISGRAQTLIQRFLPQELSSLAMSFAKMGISDPLLFKAISDRTKQIVNLFDIQGLANMAYAYGKAHIDHENPLREIFKEIKQRRLQELPTGQDISQILSAIEKLKMIEDRDFIIDLVDQLLKTKKDVDIEELTFSSWALVIIFNLYEQRGRGPTAKELQMLNELLSEIDERLYHIFLKEDIEFHAKAQINQMLLYLEYFQSEFYRPQVYGRLKLVADEYVLLSENGFERPSSSFQHEDIHMRIERLVGHELSMEQFHLGYFLDTVLDEDNKIALEVIGPSHFLSSGGKIGEEILRDRILKREGWTFVEVPITTWQELPDEDRDQYLINKLPKRLLPASSVAGERA